MRWKHTCFALAMAGVAALTGCGMQEKDAMEAVEKAQTAMEKIESLEGEMEMNVEIKASEEEYAIVTTADITAFMNPLYMKVDVSSSLLTGGPQEEIMQMYVQEQENDEITSYINVGTGWFCEKTQGENLRQYHMYKNMMRCLVEIEKPVDMGTEQIGAFETLRVEGVLKGDTMEQIIAESGIVSVVQSMGVSEETLQAMYEDLGELPITLWIDAEGMVHQYDIDMTQLMQMVMDKAMEIIGQSQLGASQEVVVEKANISMDCSNFNQAEPFEIPAEVLETELKDKSQ